MLQTAYTSRTRRKCVKIRILGDDKLEISVVGVNCVQSTCFTELSNGHARIWSFFPDRNSTLWEIVFPWWWKRGLQWLLFSGSFLQLQYWEIYNVHTGYVHIAIFVLSLRRFEPRVLSITFNFFSTLLFQTPTFWWSGIAVQQYLSIIIWVLYLFMSIYKTFINIAYIAIFLACSFSQSKK